MDDLHSFERALGVAALEARDPGEAHWCAGFAQEAARRAGALIAAGKMGTHFSEVVAGISKARRAPNDMSTFKDDTGLVALSPGSPWEAAELAARCLEEQGHAWVCLRLRRAWACGGGGDGRWCMERVAARDEGDFEGFWSRLELSIARALVEAVRGSPAATMLGDESGARNLEAWADRELLRRSCEEGEAKGPSRL